MASLQLVLLLLFTLLLYVGFGPVSFFNIGLVSWCWDCRMIFTGLGNTFLLAIIWGFGFVLSRDEEPHFVNS